MGPDASQRVASRVAETVTAHVERYSRGSGFPDVQSDVVEPGPPNTLKAAIGWDKPFNVRIPRGSVGTMDSISRATRWVTMIWPSAAWPHSRAATLITVPIALYSSRPCQPILP